MARDDERLNDMVAEFEKAHPKEGRALREMLENTPELRARTLQAVQQDSLSGFAPHPQPGNGAYNPDSKQIELPMDVLGTAKMSSALDDSANTARIVLGHEIGHAINRSAIDRTDAEFARSIAEIAKSPSPHDYAQLLRERGREQRLRESEDEIAGVDTLADYVKRTNPEATLKDLYNASTEMSAYIEKRGHGTQASYIAKGGLSFDRDLKIDPAEPKNVEAMGKLFYDARGYPQNYGSISLGLIAEAEDRAQIYNPQRPAPAVHADLQPLGIDASKVPPNFLPNGFIDGPVPAPHTPSSPSVEPGVSGTDQALNERIRGGVAEAERGIGKGWDENSERMTASLTLLAKQNGFSGRDELSVGFSQATAAQRGGESAFVYRSGSGVSPDPYANRAHISTSEAIARPAHETYQQLRDHNVQPVQGQQPAAQVQEQSAQAQPAPVMSR